jgi:hypothetical protein
MIYYDSTISSRSATNSHSTIIFLSFGNNSLVLATASLWAVMKLRFNGLNFYYWRLPGSSSVVVVVVVVVVGACGGGCDCGCGVVM